MTVLNATTGNTYLVGLIDIALEDVYNSTTEVSTIDISSYLQVEVADYPLDSGSTSAILYKVSPILTIGAVFDNTQVYQGIPNTYQIGSYNYGSRGSYHTREFVNYQLQTLKECSGLYPPEGMVAGSVETIYSFGIPNPSPYSPVDTLYLYLPNADISMSTIALHYSLEQLPGNATEYGYIWTNLSNLYGN
jgi:hypothetical protein